MRDNALLAALPRGELIRLRPHLQAISLAPKRFLLPAGEPLACAYFLRSGLVCLVVPVASGASVEVAAVGREGMLGVSLVLESDPPPYEMTCQVSGEALCVPAATFTQLVQELPVFRRLLLRYALGLLHEVARSAACSGLHSVEERMALWLLLWRDRVGAETFPVTHDVLARMLGVGRPFVTQIARGLQEAGLIRYERGVVQILNSRGLEAVACEDYRAVEGHYALLRT